MSGHYTISWHPYDPERYAELRRCYHGGHPMSLDDIDDMNAMDDAAEATPGWEDPLHLLDLAACEALMATVRARIEQLRPEVAT